MSENPNNTVKETVGRSSMYEPNMAGPKTSWVRRGIIIIVVYANKVNLCTFQNLRKIKNIHY